LNSQRIQGISRLFIILFWQKRWKTKSRLCGFPRRVVVGAAATAVLLVCLLPVTTHPVQEYFSASFVPTETQQTSILPGEKTLQQKQEMHLSSKLQ